MNESKTNCIIDHYTELYISDDWFEGEMDHVTLVRSLREACGHRLEGDERDRNVTNNFVEYFE